MLRRSMLLVWGLFWCLSSSLFADEFDNALKLEKAINTTVRVNFVKTPLVDVVDHFRKQLKIDIRISDDVDVERAVTFEGEKSLDWILTRLLTQCGLKWSMREGHLQIGKMDLSHVLKSQVKAQFPDTSLEHAIFRLGRQYGVNISIAPGIDRKQPFRGQACGGFGDVLRRLLARYGLEPTIEKGTIVIAPLDTAPTLSELMEVELRARGEWKVQRSSVEDLAKAISEQWNLNVAVGEGVNPRLQVQFNACTQGLRESLTETLRPQDLTFDVVGDTLRIVPLKSPEVALDVAMEIDFLEVPLPHALRYLQDRFQVRISDAEWENSELPVNYEGKQKLKEMLAEFLTPCGLKYQVDGQTIRIVARTLQERLDVTTDVHIVDRCLGEAVETLAKQHAIKVIFADDVNRLLLIRVDADGKAGDVLTKVLAPFRLVWKINEELEYTLRIVRQRPPTATERVEEVLASPLNVLDFSETPLEDAMQQVSERYGIPVKIGDGVNLLLRPGKGAGVSLHAALRDLLKPHNLRFEVTDGTLVIKAGGDVAR